MKKLAIAAALLSISTLSFAASMQSLNKSEATNEFQDKTMSTIPLVTLNGQLTNNTFTGYFGKDGKITGKMDPKPENASENDIGTWSVKLDGTVCVTWDTWNDHKPICVAVYKLKNGLLFVNQQTKNLETLVLSENIKTGNKLG